MRPATSLPPSPPQCPSAALAGLLLALLASPAPADELVCHYTYGGESQLLSARPVASPYAVPAVKVGSYFRFRAVFQKSDAGPGAIKLYTYADRDGGPVPIHQASYPYPPAAQADAPYGFTGLQFVYEPVRDGEFQYWCRLQADDGEAR